jgi:hypothetical protein
MNEWLNRLEREGSGWKSTPSLMAIDSQSVKMGPFLSKDRGLDGNNHAYQGTFSEIAEQVLEIEVEVAAKPESTKGFIPIVKRWVVERTFAWFNFYRRLAKDYEQNVENSAAWMFCANSWLILERFDRKTKLNF